MGRKQLEKALADAASIKVAQETVGLGVDVVEVARMETILKRTPSFAARVFSPEERAYCDGTTNRAAHYATRFAAKEAVLKALGTGFTEGIGFRDVEVRRNAKGRPFVVLSGRAQEVAREMGVREIPLSISYTHTEGVACRDVEVRRNAKGRPFVVLSGRAQEVAREMGVREIPLSISYTHTEGVACALAITDKSVEAQEKRKDPMEELAVQFKEARSFLDEI